MKIAVPLCWAKWSNTYRRSADGLVIAFRDSDDRPPLWALMINGQIVARLPWRKIRESLERVEARGGSVAKRLARPPAERGVFWRKSCNCIRRTEDGRFSANLIAPKTWVAFDRDEQVGVGDWKTIKAIVQGRLGNGR
jgi:hypothetical protein